MENPPWKRSLSSSGIRGGEVQCVGKLEIMRPKPVGFLCGSIPVPTDKSFHEFNVAALVPSPQTETAPRYRIIPVETDLNTPPHLSSFPETLLPITATRPTIGRDAPQESGSLSTNLARKGEALAVSGLVEYGNEIDVIAPADVLKQIFKIPYSKARLSIAVHRVGQTLVLNSDILNSPDMEEGEKLVRRHNKQPKCLDQSLLLNFAMHSVRMEACDCPPTQDSSPKEKSMPTVVPNRFNSAEGSIRISEHPKPGHTSYRQSNDISEEAINVKQEKIIWGQKKKGKSNKRESLRKVSQVNEKPSSFQESEKCRRVNDDGFLRVFFWQFHNFRMLLGSDLLIFSNEKYVAVSLHLWDVSRQVTPLTWLEAWLDNVLASVPELAICYHQDGVVQGYELLKTDDIFLLKGISEDGSPAFHPNVVQQNGLSVLRFLQENCKQDPGAYWLHKSAGDENIQLFDLSVVPKNHHSDNSADSFSSLPALTHRGRSDSLLSLGTLLYRTAHRLSLSLSPDNRVRCARFFRKCLEFLDERDHLVVRALAHEQFARLLLTHDEDPDLMFEVLPVESEVTCENEEPFEIFSGVSESNIEQAIHFPLTEMESSEVIEILEDAESESSWKMKFNVDKPSLMKLALSAPREVVNNEAISNSAEESIVVSSDTVTASGPIINNAAELISSRLSAVHHISQAIKSLRWTRQRQNNRVKDQTNGFHDDLPFEDFSVCACGDTDCVEVCDIREWLPTFKLDDKLWKLVLLLGESYLALGQAYKDDGQLHQALKVLELACLVYGSVPQYLEDARFISSMVCSYPSCLDGGSDMTRDDSSINFDSLSSHFIFWSKAWTLVGDIYIEFYKRKDTEISSETERKYFTKELKMSSEVIEEVERLRKKLGQFNQNCSSCSLVNCSCQSDRASSGNSASSSSGMARRLAHGRKQSRKSGAKSMSSSHLKKCDSTPVSRGGDSTTAYRYSVLKNNEGEIKKEMLNVSADTVEVNNGLASNFERNFSTAAGVGEDACPETVGQVTNKMKNGGIFNYTRLRVIEVEDDYLSISLSCYVEAIKTLGGSLTSSAEIQSVLKKKGWVCNELGRKRLEGKDLVKAEIAFADAINSFREICDYTNIMLIYCNLGHGRRAVAEEMVLKIESLEKHMIFQNAYKQAFETAKVEYCESLRHYGAAKAELSTDVEQIISVPCNLRNEVYTQYAHTYLRLGMLLAREDTVACVYERGEDILGPAVCRTRKERKHEISANDAIREALSVYESLGDLRKQEAAYAYFHLACYHRTRCMKFLESDMKTVNMIKGENAGVQRIKQYASLAERNWKKSLDFYSPDTHPYMYLAIQIERSALSFSLSSSLQTNVVCFKIFCIV
ncbi:hypothetical protein Leryth_021651 [Lithospermum erythrorhizon]|nr:hypothetical protein Leryth_021651 [Lithospermum erythrorhizon]